jgi:hypothetical protein
MVDPRIRDKLQQLIHSRPFVPFRLHLIDGRTFDVPFRGMTLLGRDFIKVGIPLTEGPHPICDHTEFLPLRLIDRVEELTQLVP